MEKLGTDLKKWKEKYKLLTNWSKARLLKKLIRKKIKPSTLNYI